MKKEKNTSPQGRDNDKTEDLVNQQP